MKQRLVFSLIAMGLSSIAMSAPANSPCVRASKALKEAVANDPAKVLIIVADKVAESPNCGCEFMKAAIATTKASPELVAAIFAAAARSAPQLLDTLANCAVAAAPDASAQIRAEAEKIDPTISERIPSWVASEGGSGNPLDPIIPTDGPNSGLPTDPTNTPPVIVPPVS